MNKLNFIMWVQGVNVIRKPLDDTLTFREASRASDWFPLLFRPVDPLSKLLFREGGGVLYPSATVNNVSFSVALQPRISCIFIRI